MNKNIIRIPATFFVLVISIFVVSQISAQNKQEISADFFLGRWAGRINHKSTFSSPVSYSENNYVIEIVDLIIKDSSLEFTGFAELTIDTPILNLNVPQVQSEIIVLNNKTSGRIAGEILLEDKFIRFYWEDYEAMDRIKVKVRSYADGKVAEVEVGFSYFPRPGQPAMIDFQLYDEHILLSEDILTPGGKITLRGELYRISTKKEILGEDVKVNELIKTDRHTRREITIPNVGEVVINTNSEGVFKSESWFEQTLGEIHSKMKPGIDYKVRMPQAVSSVRGTKFITKVEKDGTTTLIVLDGTVEFSDINKKKTVLVKKNQKSVVKQGGLPSNPVLIKSALIPMWWQ